MAIMTGLSGNEMYCLALKNLGAGELVVGNSVHSLGFLGGIGAGFQNMFGGEATQITDIIHEGRQPSFKRMLADVNDDLMVVPGCEIDPMPIFLEGVAETNLIPSLRCFVAGCYQDALVFAWLDRVLVSAARFASLRFLARCDWNYFQTNSNKRLRAATKQTSFSY